MNEPGLTKNGRIQIKFFGLAKNNLNLNDIQIK